MEKKPPVKVFCLFDCVAFYLFFRVSLLRVRLMLLLQKCYTTFISQMKKKLKMVCEEGNYVFISIYHLVFTCSMKGAKFRSKTSGRLYLTQSYLVFVTNNLFAKDHVCHSFWNAFTNSLLTFISACGIGMIYLILLQTLLILLIVNPANWWLLTKLLNQYVRVDFYFSTRTTYFFVTFSLLLLRLILSYSDKCSHIFLALNQIKKRLIEFAK